MTHFEIVKRDIEHAYSSLMPLLKEYQNLLSDTSYSKNVSMHVADIDFSLRYLTGIPSDEQR